MNRNKKMQMMKVTALLLSFHKCWINFSNGKLTWQFKTFKTASTKESNFLLSYREVTSSRPVHYSIFEHFWGATDWDVLLSKGYYIEGLLFNFWTFLWCYWPIRATNRDMLLLATLWYLIQKPDKQVHHYFLGFTILPDIFMFH